jgi:O-antigen/teichoic acid export membrane protein
LAQSRSVLKNTGITFAGQVLPLIAALVSMPVLYKNLGPDRIGVLTLIWSVFGYFAFLDLGLAKAVTKSVADVLSTDEEERIGEILWTALLVQATLGVVGAIVLAIGASFLMEHLLNVPPALVDETRVAFVLAASTLPVVIVSSTLGGLFDAAQRFDLKYRVMLPVSLVNYLLPMLLTIWWPDLRVVVVILIVTRCSGVILQFFLASRLFPQIRRIRATSREWFKSLLGYGGWVTISNIMKMLLNTGDRFVMGSLLTMSAVAYYTIPFDLATKMWIIPTSILSVMFPIFATLSSQGNVEELNLYFGQTVRNMICLVGLLALTLAVGARDVMTIWMGQDFASHTSVVLQIIAVAVIVDSIASIPAQLLQAIGRADLTAKIQLIQIPFYFVLVWIAVKKWGGMGAAAVWGFRVLVDFVLFFVAAHRIAGIRAHSFLQFRIPGVFAFLSCIGIASLAGSEQLTDQLHRIALAAFVFAFGAVFTWSVFLKASERQKALMLLQRIVS